MTTLIAVFGYSNLSWRQSVSYAEEATIRTGIGTKALRPEEVDGHESADEEEWYRNPDGRKCLPKIFGYEVVRERGNQRLVWRFCDCAVQRRPDEHVKSRNERNVDQQTRAKRFWSKADLL